MPRAAVPLHRYQREWLADGSRYKIGMFARQCGKTFATTLEIVDDCYQALVEGRKSRWVILSRGERQAEEAMREGVKRHARAYGLALEELRYDFVSEDGERACKALEVVLPGGSRITALPANPDTARGYSANVYLDEFALHRDSRRIWAALYPVISAGHKLRVTSTPQGKSNKFYELMTDAAAGRVWSRHVVDIHRAVADGLPRDAEELRVGLGDDELWRQEYELEWLDEASAWLPFDLINSCEDPLAGDPSRHRGGPTYVGNDIARRGDLWVAWTWELVGDVLWTREVRELRDQPFAAHDAALRDIDERWHPRRIAMDQTGMGEKPVEDAKRRHGASRVEGVVFTAPARLDLATALKAAMQDRKVRLPQGDRRLRSDLHSVKRVAGPTGPRLLVEDDGNSGGSHADRFWAAALGVAAASLAPAPAAYEPVAPARPPDHWRMRDRPDHSGDWRRPASLSGYVGGMGRARWP